MNLRKKRILAAKALGVGKNRIRFKPESLSEIKEAITKQDIKSLHSEGAIMIQPVTGRRAVEKRKRKRGAGKIKIKVNTRKQNYVRLTRKLRAHVRTLKHSGQLARETYHDIRKKIKNKHFKSKENLKEYIRGIESTVALPEKSQKKRSQGEKNKTKKSPQKGSTK